MLKSILLPLGVALVVVPLAAAARAPRQDAATPVAAAQTPEPAQAASGIPADTKNPVKPSTAGMAKAKELYTIDCAMCHGDNGNGKTDLATSMNIVPADFADSKMMEAIPDGAMFNIIRAGKGKMPGEDPVRAKDVEVWNLVTYVRNFSKPPATTAAVK